MEAPPARRHGVHPAGGLFGGIFAGPLATLLWRHQRVVLFEVGTITANLEGAAKDARIARAYAQGTLSKGILPDLSSEQMERQAWRHLLPSDEDIDRIMRYGGSIHRQILQIFHEIEAMQARRKGERTPLARLDITGPPGA